MITIEKIKEQLHELNLDCSEELLQLVEKYPKFFSQHYLAFLTTLPNEDALQWPFAKWYVEKVGHSNFAIAELNA